MTKNHRRTFNTLFLPALISAVFFVIFNLLIPTTPPKSLQNITQNSTQSNLTQNDTTQNTPNTPNLQNNINFNPYWLPNEQRTPQEDTNTPLYASPFACFNVQYAIDNSYANKITDYYNYYKQMYNTETKKWGMASDIAEYFYALFAELYNKTGDEGSYSLNVYFYRNELKTTYKIVKTGQDTAGIIITDAEGNTYLNGYFNGEPIYSGASKMQTDFLPVLTEETDFLITQLGVPHKAIYWQNLILGHIIDLGTISDLSTNLSGVSQNILEYNIDANADSYITLLQKIKKGDKISNGSIFFNIVTEFQNSRYDSTTDTFYDSTCKIKAMGFTIFANDMPPTCSMLYAQTLVGFTA